MFNPALGAAAAGAAEKEAEAQADLLKDQLTAAQVSALLKAIASVAPYLVAYLQQSTLKTSVDNFPAFPTEIGTPDMAQVVEAIGRLGETIQPLPQDHSDIVGALSEVSAKLDSLPAAPEAVAVTNLSEIKTELAKGLDGLLKALKALELSPKITVPKPEVHIQAPDFAVVVKAIKELQKQVKAIPVPKLSVEKPDFSQVVQGLGAVQQAIEEKPVPGQPAVPPTDPLIRFAPADIDDAGLVKYYGFIQDTGAWYIQQIDTSASPKTIRFAMGAAGYVTAFAGRASLAYAIWGT